MVLAHTKGPNLGATDLAHPFWTHQAKFHKQNPKRRRKPHPPSNKGQGGTLAQRGGPRQKGPKTSQNRKPKNL